MARMFSSLQEAEDFLNQGRPKKRFNTLSDAATFLDTTPESPQKSFKTVGEAEDFLDEPQDDRQAAGRTKQFLDYLTGLFRTKPEAEAAPLGPSFAPGVVTPPARGAGSPLSTKLPTQPTVPAPLPTTVAPEVAPPPPTPDEVEIEPGSEKDFLRRGLVEFMDNRPDKALAAWEEGLKKFPGSKEMARGIERLRGVMPGQADPKSMEKYSEGMAAYKAGDYDAMERSFQEAEQIDPENPWVKKARGSVIPRESREDLRLKRAMEANKGGAVSQFLERIAPDVAKMTRMAFPAPDPRKLQTPGDVVSAAKKPILAPTAPLRTEQGKRMAGAAGSGVVGSLAGMVAAEPAAEAFLGLDTPVGRAASKTARQLRKLAGELSPNDPGFAEKLASGAGSAALFFVPGVGTAKAVSLIPKTATMLTKMAPALATGVSTLLESATESGGVYQNLVDKGVSRKEAGKAAFKDFWTNAIVIGLTNRFGVFSDKLKGVRKALVSSPLEGIQEAAQDILAEVSEAGAEKRPVNIDWDQVAESAGIGAIIGGGMGGGMSLLESSVLIPDQAQAAGATEGAVDEGGPGGPGGGAPGPVLDPEAQAYVQAKFPALAETVTGMEIPLPADKAKEVFTAAVEAGENVLLNGGRRTEADAAALKAFTVEAARVMGTTKPQLKEGDEARLKGVVEKTGGEWKGIYKDRRPWKEDSVYFNDPETKTTLTLPISQVTEQNIKRRLAGEEIGRKPREMKEPVERLVERFEPEGVREVTDEDVDKYAVVLRQQAIEERQGKTSLMERFIREHGGIAPYQREKEPKGKKPEAEEYAGIPVHLRGRIPYDEMAEMLKEEGIVPPDASYTELYRAIERMPKRGVIPPLSTFKEQARYDLENNPDIVLTPPPPIDKKSLRRSLRETFNLDAQQSTAAAEVADAWAEQWAKDTGRPKGDWYKSRIADVRQGLAMQGEEETLFQTADLFPETKQNVGQSYERLFEDAKLRGMNEKQARKWVLERLAKSTPQDVTTRQGGQQMGFSVDPVHGFGEGAKGERFLFQDEDYTGQHRPPDRESGAPLNDLTGEGRIYPDDIYGPEAARYYGHGEPGLDNRTIGIIQALRDKPGASVKIYRAVPDDITTEEKIRKLEKQMAEFMRRGKVPEGQERKGWYDLVSDEVERLKAIPQQDVDRVKINPGDWVTVNPDYAREHGKSTLRGNYRLLSKTVRADEVFTNGDSIHEYGYWPKGVKAGGPKQLPQRTFGPQQTGTTKGATEFLEDTRAIIHAFAQADVSTAFHELSHVFRRDLYTRMMEAKDARTRDEIGGHIQAVENWVGAKKGVWTEAQEEKFARGFERYMAEGKAPTHKLKTVFEKAKEWLIGIYRAIRGSKIDVNLTPPVRKAFDRMLGGEGDFRARPGASAVPGRPGGPPVLAQEEEGNVERRPAPGRFEDPNIEPDEGVIDEQAELAFQNRVEDDAMAQKMFEEAFAKSELFAEPAKNPTRHPPAEVLAAMLDPQEQIRDLSLFEEFRVPEELKEGQEPTVLTLPLFGQAGETSTLAPIRAMEAMDRKRFGIMKRNFLFPIQDADMAFQDELRAKKDEAKDVFKGLNAEDREMIFDLVENKQRLKDKWPPKDPRKTERLIKAARWLQDEYDTMLDRLNMARAAIGKDPIQRRKNYITHYQELSAVQDIAKMVGMNMVDVPNSMLSISAMTKPNSPYFRFAKRRLGNKTDRDSLKAYMTYLEPALRTIHFARAIKNGRDILEYKVNIPGEYEGATKSGKVDTRSLFGIRYPNAYNYLNNYLNRLAGKRDPVDRLFPAAASVAGVANRLFSAGSIGGNLSTVIVQPSSIRNAVAETGIFAIPGYTAILTPRWNRFYHQNSRVAKGRSYEPATKGERLMGSKILAELHNKASEALSIPVSAVDGIMVGGAYLAGYFKAKSLGFSREESMRFADDVAERTQASANQVDRPPVNAGKIKNMIGQFQTFIYNEWSQIKNDMVKKAIEGEKSPQGYEGGGLKGIREGRGVGIKRFGLYVAATMALGAIYDELGIPNPFRLDGAQMPFVENPATNYLWERVINQIPGVSSVRFGGSPFIKGAFNGMLYLTGTEQDKKRAVARLKGTGFRLVPGGGQISKTLRGYKISADIKDLHEKALALIFGPFALREYKQLHPDEADKMKADRKKVLKERRKRLKKMREKMGRGKK